METAGLILYLFWPLLLALMYLPPAFGGVDPQRRQLARQRFRTRLLLQLLWLFLAPVVGVLLGGWHMD